ncbi:hypothetical protein BpHYR1_030747 [Brachionus plicatilis]|uniref:Uncharacterized protein n=1 Tax=Brachionus plicatilis TaxID=10195 RepID=A0A3M7PSE9_BRAPC|nr:hypothetical protein BpHYR1_030747 [Brachionus plicatilis]
MFTYSGVPDLVIYQNLHFTEQKIVNVMFTQPENMNCSPNRLDPSKGILKRSCLQFYQEF